MRRRNDATHPYYTGRNESIMSNKSRKEIQMLIQESIIEDGITTFQCNPHTIVEVYVEVFDKVGHLRLVRGVGYAKLGKNDKWNSVIGYEVAYGRAIADIIKQYKKLRQ